MEDRCLNGLRNLSSPSASPALQFGLKGCPQNADACPRPRQRPPTAITRVTPGELHRHSLLKIGNLPSIRAAAASAEAQSGSRYRSVRGRSFFIPTERLACWLRTTCKSGHRGIPESLRKRLQALPASPAAQKRAAMTFHSLMGFYISADNPAKRPRRGQVTTTTQDEMNKAR